METAAATDAPAEANPLVQAALAVAPTPVAEPGSEAATPADGVFRKITVPAKGLYRFEAPVGSGIMLSINGQLVIDASGAPVGDATTITALHSMTPGDHAIEITGVDADAPELSGLTFSPIGSEPRPLMDASLSITPGEASTLAVANSALSPSATEPAALLGDRSAGALPGMAPGAGKEAFAIGGSSSKSSRTSPAGPAASGGAMAEGSTGGSMRSFNGGGGTQMASAPATQTTPSTTSGGGSLSSVPSSGGGGSASGTPSTGTPGTPPATAGLPPVTPTPTPAPTPTPITPTTPTLETVRMSPLSPPANPQLTQAVQLTSAGNVNSQVPSSGSTLFGAVMDNSMFDIVNVAVSTSNRTTTVDVGPMTGQFAVRLFPEDFASGQPVQVTLTGASTASDEVTATPVSYTLTGMPAQDGVGQALSRLTFGATPDLYARVRAMGFANYVEEQLNPDTINDQAFAAMNANALLDPTNSNGGQLLRSLTNYDIAHAAFSERQLQEVMGRFWANHFHAVTKDTDMYQQNITDRQFFRDNAFGNFGDLLLYSARSPLMSQYLDNDQNRYREGRENDGINENYGREVLELSTVGVEAGYQPVDVDAVSRVFSGWGYERTNPNAEGVAREYRFLFREGDHDPNPKPVPFLGVTIPPGQAGGEQLISLLANHPSTQARTCRKMVQLLVSDAAPQSFVDACVTAWATTGGEIEPMLRAILLDPAYVANADYQRNKAKTPFEYAVSVIRAFDARPENAQDSDFYTRFRNAFEQAGESYLRFPVPTGLPEYAAAWLNSATMVASYNQITDVAERRQEYGIDLAADIADAGLETAEEVAGYLLTVATADQFTREEYEAVVATLKGDDGIFEPRVQDETRALERAMGLIVVTPSFQIQ
ncbi:MAG: DUF1800 family protein [Pseudomonadota bacterium]